MRNLVQYPITYEELLADLATSVARYNPQEHGIGGTEGVSLDMIKMYLTVNEQSVRQFLATMQDYTAPVRPTSPPSTLRRECDVPEKPSGGPWRGFW